MQLKKEEKNYLKLSNLNKINVLIIFKLNLNKIIYIYLMKYWK
jgi:hypothetical protein